MAVTLVKGSAVGHLHQKHIGSLTYSGSYALKISICHFMSLKVVSDKKMLKRRKH